MCVVQVKDTKHIRRDFHSVTLVMSQVWDFGALGVPRRGQIFFFKHGHVAYQIDGDDKQTKMQVNFHPRLWGGYVKILRRIVHFMIKA